MGAFVGGWRRWEQQQLGAWTQQKQRQSGRKEADSPPILINGVFSAVPDAGLRTAAPSLGSNVGISKSSWDDLAPGLARGKPCRVSRTSKSVDAAPRLGAREEREPSRLAGAGQGPRVHHHRALRPRPRARPPSPNCPPMDAGQLNGRCFQVPPRCLVAPSKALQDGRMRPRDAVSAGRRINF